MSRNWGRLRTAPGTTGDLYDGLSEPLRRAKVSAEEALVGVENDYECYVREVVPLRHHLGPDENARFAGRHPAHDLLHVAAPTNDVAIETRECYSREEAAQGLLDALGPLAYGLHCKPALWAARR